MSSISTPIPGTDYTLRGDTFVGKDGTTLTQDQFVDKVSKKEISLTGDSLKFLDTQLGPDTMSSLRTGSGFQTPPGEIGKKLDTSEQAMTDLFSLMQVLARVTQEQKKSMTDIKHGEHELQIKFLEESAKKELEAGNWKAAIGIIQGAFTVAAGAATAWGGIEGIKGGEAAMSQWGGQGKMLEGTGGIVGGLLSFITTDLENQAKTLDIQARKQEAMVGESKDQLDAIREMHSKVKELLQSIQQAESQTARNVSSM